MEERLVEVLAITEAFRLRRRAPTFGENQA